MSVYTGYFVTVQLGNLSVYVHSLIWNFTEYPTNSFKYFLAWRTVLAFLCLSFLGYSDIYLSSVSCSFIPSSMPFSSCCNAWATLIWTEDQSNRGSCSLWVWEWVGRQEQGDALTSPPWMLKMIVAVFRQEAVAGGGWATFSKERVEKIVFRVVFVFVLGMSRSVVELDGNC